MNSGSVAVVAADEQEGKVYYRHVDASYHNTTYLDTADKVRERLIRADDFFNSARGIEVAVEVAMCIEVFQSELADGGDPALYSLISTFSMFFESIMGWLPETGDYPATYEMMLNWLEHVAAPRIEDYETPDIVFEELLDD